MEAAHIIFDKHTATIYCQGEWTLRNALKLQKLLLSFENQQEIPLAVSNQLTLKINGKAIEKIDSLGALLFQQWIKHLAKENQKIVLEDFKSEHETLIAMLDKQVDSELIAPHPSSPNILARFGKITIVSILNFLSFLNFIGELTFIGFHLLREPKRIQWRAWLKTIETAGFEALPIIALLSCLIGVVLTYQMGLQLRNYGANIYIVDLLGLSIFREFAPLMTAVIIAGRTGSAFTAQIGTMQIREEIDALRTMGITPHELLILPKILALFITVPLLTVWSDMFGVLGGMIMAKGMLKIQYYDFLHRFQQAVSLRSFTTGILKAPIFGLIISSIGCFQGMHVNGSAVSIGRQTTISVVQSIFFIIVADAIFSIIFSFLGI